MKRSPRELESELEDLERAPRPRPQWETSDDDSPTLDALAAAYGDVLGHWRASYQAPDEYKAATDWLFGRREQTPPVLSPDIRAVLIELLEDWAMWELLYDLTAAYDDIHNEGGYPPTPEEREAMIDAVRETSP